MKLKCEVGIKGICIKEFEAAKDRPIKICPKCIEELRKKDLGPEQLLWREEIRERILSIIRRER